MLIGIVGVAFAILFFLQKFALVEMSFVISETVYLYFFAGFALIAGIVILFKALGLSEFGMHR
jgi:hypothetical protein